MEERGSTLIIITMVFGVLMDGIDGSIVNVALPSIADSFGTDTSVVSWVTISYFLMLASPTPAIYARSSSRGSSYSP